MKISNLLLILSLLVLNSCQFKKSEQEISKPEQELNKPEQELNKFEQELKKEHEYKIISLKDSSSYDDVCLLVRKNMNQGFRSAVEILDGENLKTVPLENPTGGLRKERNKLHMTLDSIYASEIGEFPRKKLKIALKKFYEKRGNRGHVQILLSPTTTSKELESLLLNLIQEFDKMNSETEQLYYLGIFLSDKYPKTPPLLQN